MERTKLGVSIPVMGALTFVVFLAGGYVAGLLLLGYILLCEENTDLKKTAVTALLITVGLSLVSILISFLPDVVDVFESFLSMFGVYLGGGFIDTFFNFLYRIFNVVKTAVLVVFAALTMMGKPVRLSFIDKLIG